VRVHVVLRICGSDYSAVIVSRDVHRPAVLVVPEPFGALLEDVPGLRTGEAFASEEVVEQATLVIGHLLPLGHELERVRA
jgi:hypothetical protein